MINPDEDIKENQKNNLRVKYANKRFFDNTAAIYEGVDHRRKDEITNWLDDVLIDLSRATGNGHLIDLGTGTGIILKYGKRHFRDVVGIDLSVEMLKQVASKDHLVCGDIESLPFKKETFNVVSCFAVLHHCCTYLPIFKEAHRILRSKGMIYIDHDIDRDFILKHRWILGTYRRIFGMKKEYLSKGIDEELHDLSEYHSEGLSVDEIVRNLMESGFGDIRVRYHWKGFNRWVNGIMRRFEPRFLISRGNAPVFSITAVKI